jgi:serine/threonine protein phosphatase PrpC
MLIETAFTQHRGNNPGQQDALWNGEQVFQQDDLPCGQHNATCSRLVVAVADGVASSPFPQRASRHVLESLATEIAGGAAFDVRLVRRVHGYLCDALAKGRTFGSSTTLAAAMIQQDQCRVLSVGDSRVYRIAADGAWQQLSRDHTLINAMIERGEAAEGTEYASFYNMLDACLVADDEETEFPVHRANAPFLPGDTLLVCTDGVHDTLGDPRLMKTHDARLAPLDQVIVWRKAVMAKGAPDNFSMVLVQRQS